MNFLREKIHQTAPANVQANSQSEVNTAWSGYFASKWPNLRKVSRNQGLKIYFSIESVEIKMADCRHSGPFQNAFHEGLTVWSLWPCSLVLPRPRLAGLSLLLLGSSETRSFKIKIIWERCHFYYILSLIELDSSKHNIEISFESIDHNWLK